MNEHLKVLALAVVKRQCPQTPLCLAIVPLEIYGINLQGYSQICDSKNFSKALPQKISMRTFTMYRRLH